LRVESETLGFLFFFLFFLFSGKREGIHVFGISVTCIHINCRRMFVVCTVFKNEAPLLREWVEHYLLVEGAVHLFLVDHGSTDAPRERVRDYADRITWFEDARPFEPGVQAQLLNEHVLPKVQGGKCWVLVCDVDEYLYAPRRDQTVAGVLDAMPDTVRRVWVPWKVFGGNGHADRQPEAGVVRGFTRRAKGVSLPYKRVGTAFGQYESHLGLGKMAARGVTRLGVHESETLPPQLVYGWDEQHTPAHHLHALPARPVLELNHYMYMSRAYYLQVKCARGGGQTGHSTGKYTMEYYDQTEPGCNAVKDEALAVKLELRSCG